MPIVRVDQRLEDKREAQPRQEVREIAGNLKRVNKQDKLLHEGYFKAAGMTSSAAVCLPSRSFPVAQRITQLKRLFQTRLIRPCGGEADMHAALASELPWRTSGVQTRPGHRLLVGWNAFIQVHNVVPSISAGAHLMRT